MPFKSQAQRRKFYAMAARGEISKSTLEHWKAATPKGEKLPEKVKSAMSLPLKATLIGGALGGATGGLIGAVSPDTYVGTTRVKPTWRDRLSSGLTGAGIGATFGGLTGLTAGLRLSQIDDAYRAYTPPFTASGWEKKWAEQQAGRARYGRGYGRGGGQRYSRASRSASNTPPAWVVDARTKAEAKNAFRQEAMKHHPDVGGDVEKMKQINMEWEAYKNSPAFNKLSYVAFFDELTKIADLAGLVAAQLARREVTPPVTSAIGDLEEDIAERWRRFSTPTLDTL